MCWVPLHGPEPDRPGPPLVGADLDWPPATVPMGDGEFDAIGAALVGALVRTDLPDGTEIPTLARAVDTAR